MKVFSVLLASRMRTLVGRVRGGTPRERVLVAALGLVGLLIFLSADLRLLRGAISDWRSTTARVEKAEAVKRNAPLIERILTEKSGALTGRPVSASELLATLENHARECGLTPDAGTPRSERAGRLMLHRVRLAFQSADLRQLMRFDDRLQRGADGISVDRVVLESRATGDEVSVTYELVACQPSE